MMAALAQTVYLTGHASSLQKDRSRLHSGAQASRNSKIPVYIYKHSYPLSTTTRHQQIIKEEIPVSGGQTYRDK